jgi:hypothetical protein
MSDMAFLIPPPVLSALGVPAGLIIGAYATILLNRRRLKKLNGFDGRVRLREGKVESTPGLRDTWKPCLALWVHDVLILYAGTAQIRMVALPVASIAGSPARVDPQEVKRLGDEPFAVELRLDGGQVIEFATKAETRDRLPGPFASARSPAMEGAVAT